MDVQIGERWAHRRRKNDTPAEVEILRIGTRQPPKVFVRFVDDEYEGREEWCSVRSLKVLWPELSAFLALEQRWVDVRKASPPEHDLEVEAASIVVSELMDRYSEGGVVVPGCCGCTSMNRCRLVGSSICSGSWITTARRRGRSSGAVAGAT